MEVCRFMISTKFESPQGVTADGHEDMARMLMDISFPEPTLYDGSEGTPGLPVTTFLAVSDFVIQRAFRGTSCKKSPGPDGIGPLAIRCMYDWDPGRIVALIRAPIQLGLHPRQWKTGREVTIPKPGKDDYGLAKSYRVISLLNCIGEVVEMVATMASAHCEVAGRFHLGQSGYRTNDRPWTQSASPSPRLKRHGVAAASPAPS